MPRLIGGTLLGYVVYFAIVFALMTAAWLLLGANGAFRPGAWDVTSTWIVIMLLASLTGGMVAGYPRIAADPRGPMALAGLVVVMGVLFAWPLLAGTATAPTMPRPDQLPMFDAMSQGQAPLWVALVNPLLGAVGVLLGARLRRPA